MAVKIPEHQSKVAALWMAAGEADNWLQHELDLALTENQPLWDEEKLDHFSPSLSGEVCVRFITLERFGHNVPHDAQTMRIFRVGKKIEEGVVEDLMARGLFHSTNEWIEVDDPPFRGRYDVIVCKNSTGEKLLGEIKSCKQEVFDRLPKPASDPQVNIRNLLEQHRGYVTQWQIYSAGTGIDKGFLYFECRNTGRTAIFWLVRSQALLDEVYSIFHEAKQYLDKRLVAPVPEGRRPTDKKDPVCRWCKANYLCVKLPVEAVDIDMVKRIDRAIRGK